MGGEYNRGQDFSFADEYFGEERELAAYEMLRLISQQIDPLALRAVREKSD